MPGHQPGRQARRQPRGNRLSLCHVPYISGAYGWNESDQLAEVPSLVENNSWFLNTTMMGVLVCGYDPDDAHRRDP